MQVFFLVALTIPLTKFLNAGLVVNVHSYSSCRLQLRNYCVSAVTAECFCGGQSNRVTLSCLKLLPQQQIALSSCSCYEETYDY